MSRLDVVRDSRPLHYAIALFAAVAAAAIRLSLTSVFAARNSLVLFYPAIMVSAWLGGMWPGIVATFTSAALADYFFLEPFFSLRVTHHGDKLVLAIFVLVGIVISVLNENLHRVAKREQHARQDAERARAQADAANRTKDFFMAAVSHDLRAPITATLGWVDMLNKHILDEAQQQHAFEVIHRAVNRQLLLVNDLLDSAAILSGKLRVEQKTVAVESVVRAAVEIAEPLAAPKRLRINVQCDIQPTTLIGDSARLQQVVSNLLMNAIKFTPNAGDIRVQVTRTDSHVDVEVSDSGRGIRPEALPLVFEGFWQDNESSATRAEKGVGLGLAIAKHLVVAHGGTIEATSDGDGRGATFRIRLPLAGNPAATQHSVHRQFSPHV